MLATQIEACFAKTVTADGLLAMRALKGCIKTMLSHDVWKDDKAPDQEYSDDAKPRFSQVKTDQMAAKADEQRQSHVENRELRIQRASTISAFDHGSLGWGGMGDVRGRRNVRKFSECGARETLRGRCDSTGCQGTSIHDFFEVNTR